MEMLGISGQSRHLQGGDSNYNNEGTIRNRKRPICLVHNSNKHAVSDFRAYMKNALREKVELIKLQRSC